MLLIIKNYLQTLKEKDELDLLLCDLLLQSGYILDSIPKTGSRQFGVDIQAHSKTELLLLVVKQGNIDRTVWSGGPNAVRQSLDEIFDVSLRNLSPSDQKKKIRVIVATNGYLDEPAKLNWQGYQDAHQSWQEKKISFDFWGLDEIASQVRDKMFSERLFPKELQALFRKALYFAEEPDYKPGFFEQIVDAYIDKLPAGFSSREKRQAQKTLSGLMLGAQMIAQYAADVRRYRIAVAVFEYVIIRLWKWMLQNDGMGKPLYSEWIIRFYKKYEEWCWRYFDAVKSCCAQPGAFPAYADIVEQKVQMYEMVGLLSSFAFGESFIDPSKANRVLEAVLQLINNYPQFYYPPYDDNIAQITVLCRALIHCGRREDAVAVMNNFAYLVSAWYQLTKKHPSPADTFRDALDIELGNEHEEYSTSVFWGFLLLWIAVLKDQNTYDAVKSFLKNDLKDVTKCIWIMRADEELSLYDPGAMICAGDGITMHPDDDFGSFQKEVEYILRQYQEERFSFDTYSFPALEMILSHYYGILPRVIADGE